MDNNKTLRTEDYNNYIGAGEINEMGIEFTFDEIKEFEGRFDSEVKNQDGTVSKIKKPFWVISGFDPKGMNINTTDIQISMGSAKLHKMIMDNFTDLKGHRIRLCGSGKSFDREYAITILD